MLWPILNPALGQKETNPANCVIIQPMLGCFNPKCWAVLTQTRQQGSSLFDPTLLIQVFFKSVGQICKTLTGIQIQQDYKFALESLVASLRTPKSGL